jgi:hypothetical protein
MGNKTLTYIKGGVSVFMAAVAKWALAAIPFFGSIARWGFLPTLKCLAVFMKDTKEKLRDFGEKAQSIWVKIEVNNPKLALILVWLACILEYLVCLLVVVLVCNALFDHFNLFHHPSPPSVKYMLSALVQSEAAIIAIVITLTLIAVELAAHAYSPRVVDIFRKNPDMWILLFFYCLSIFYGLIVLKQVSETDGKVENLSFSLFFSPNFISLEHISFAIWLGIFTFVALFPYIWNITNLLKLKKIIEKLAIKIHHDKILKLKEAEDPFQPIVDIINRSIVNHDFETTRMGLDVLTKRMEYIVFNDEERISERFCYHLHEIFKLAASRADEESTKKVITKLKEFGEFTAKNQLKNATVQAAKKLEDVGKATAKNKKFSDATEQAVSALEAVGKAAVDSVILTIEVLGGVSANKGKSLEGMTLQKNIILIWFLLRRRRKELEDMAVQAVISLGAVGVASAKKGKELEKATERAANALGSVGSAAAIVGKKLENVTERVASLLEIVGKTAAKKGLDKPAERTASALGSVGVKAAEKGLGNVTERTAEALGNVGITSAIEGLEEATERAANSLVAVGVSTVEKEELKTAKQQVVFSLAALTILSEVIVKEAIDNHENGLLDDKERSETFQKFKKQYKEKLEIMRKRFCDKSP